MSCQSAPAYSLPTPLEQPLYPLTSWGASPLPPLTGRGSTFTSRNQQGASSLHHLTIKELFTLRAVSNRG
ncbi:unnamed protein product [Staurois parvus]|uniref:Uncharacterized protein n=1 Tax=Staurois parvus TaxID=386267 RepID=A0ABN9H6I3_9NEOB|nr:unnamed protein product [Staurois parvus]